MLQFHVLLTAGIIHILQFINWMFVEHLAHILQAVYLVLEIPLWTEQA